MGSIFGVALVRPSVSDWNRFEEWLNGIRELSFLGINIEDNLDNVDFPIDF